MWKGSLNLEQFAAALSHLAVAMLSREPWASEYPSDAEKIHAVFSRVGIHDPYIVRSRMKGFGGFSGGNGGVRARDGQLLSKMEILGFNRQLGRVFDAEAATAQSKHGNRNATALREIKMRETSQKVDLAAKVLLMSNS